MKSNTSNHRTRTLKALSGGYDNDDVFTNCNRIRELAGEFDLIDIIDPTSAVCGKLMEIVARAKCLKEFELIPDGHTLFKDPSREESPEGVGQVRARS